MQKIVNSAKTILTYYLNFVRFEILKVVVDLDQLVLGISQCQYKSEEVRLVSEVLSTTINQ